MVNLMTIVSQTGGGTHGRNFALSLNKFHKVCLRPLQNVVVDLTPEEEPMIEEMRRRRYDRSRVSILIGYPVEMVMKLRGPVSVGYTVFELDKIPSGDINNYRKLTEIWTASRWGQRILKEHGVDSRVVPEGVNLNIFHPGPGVQNKIWDNMFSFLSAGRLYERKNIATLIEAFCEEFLPEEEVVLIGVWFDFETGMENAVKLVSRHTKNGHKIFPDVDKDEATIFVHPVLPTKRELANLYRSVDCGVFPHRAEGWNLPLIEMMACGKPCIATNYSAPTEYINDTNCYLLSPGKLIPAIDPRFGLDGTQGRWADPSKEELKALMRRAFSQPDEVRQLGQEAAEQMKQWTWDNAARIASSYINELEEKYNLRQRTR